MKRYLKLLQIVLLAICLNSFSSCGQNKDTTIQTKGTTVYICNSSGAKVYHSSQNCRGLNNCTHGVIAVSQTDAINKYSRRACKICE
jgi:hypothetical protein